MPCGEGSLCLLISSPCSPALLSGWMDRTVSDGVLRSLFRRVRLRPPVHLRTEATSRIYVHIYRAVVVVALLVTLTPSSVLDVEISNTRQASELPWSNHRESKTTEATGWRWRSRLITASAVEAAKGPAGDRTAYVSTPGKRGSRHRSAYSPPCWFPHTHIHNTPDHRPIGDDDGRSRERASPDLPC